MTDARALFLDRDGIINVDHGYVHRIDQVEWVEGIFDLARTAHALGLKLIVVTNQAGIGRGYYAEADFHALMDWMRGMFAQAGAPLTAVYFCPDHPEGVGAYRRTSDRRKPAPGMLLEAARDHQIDLTASYLIGDQFTDIQAGQAAKLFNANLALLTQAEITQLACRVVRSHVEAIDWLQERCPRS